MKLEHSKQNIAPWPVFLRRVGRYGFFALSLIFLSVFIGMCGYCYFGNLNWVDSFHMACMILTGMGPVVELTTKEAKLFDSFYALYSGVAFLSIVAVFFAPFVHRLLHILHVENRDDKDD